MAQMTITVDKQGRRHYLRGNTYPIRDRLREAGAKWDPEERCWWTGKAETAAELIQQAADTEAPRQQERKAPGMAATVAGRATYKGKSYYLAARVYRQTAYDVDISLVETRDGAKILLYARDGSFQFWADRASVEIGKTYSTERTIRGLHKYAEQAKQARAAGIERCECGGFHDDTSDGCYLCGCPRCDGARGGLCHHD
jgi:hypothetical protein